MQALIVQKHLTRRRLLGHVASQALLIDSPKLLKAAGTPTHPLVVQQQQNPHLPSQTL